MNSLFSNFPVLEVESEPVPESNDVDHDEEGKEFHLFQTFLEISILPSMPAAASIASQGGSLLVKTHLISWGKDI